MVLGALALIASAYAPAALGGAEATPEPPDNRIDMVPGQPIYLPRLNVSEFDVDEVRFDVDGTPFLSQAFAPFGEYISTRGRFERLEFEKEVVHTLTATAIEFFDQERQLAQYPLVVHSLPVVDKVKVIPLVITDRTKLVGFQLRGLSQGYRVMAWGQGFRGTSIREHLTIKRRKGGASSRTYRVPGGLEWRRGVRPRLIVSIAAKPGTLKFDFPVRGRVIDMRLTTKRNGDTGYRQTDGWKRCAWNLGERGRPPRRASCERF